VESVAPGKRRSEIRGSGGAVHPVKLARFEAGGAAGMLIVRPTNFYKSKDRPSMLDRNIEFTPGEVSRYYDVRVPELNQRGAQWRCPCRIHGGTGDNFAVEPDTGRWFCFSKCQRGGDIIALEMEMTHVDFKTARAEVCQIVGRFETDNRRNVTRANKQTSSPCGAKPSRKSSGKWRELDRYPYQDESGQLLYEVVRYLKPDGNKTFVQVRPSGVEAAGTTDPNRTGGVPTGGIVVGLNSGKYLRDPKAERRTGKPSWRWAPDQKKDYGGAAYRFGNCPRVPYGLKELLTADTVFVPEGEKDVQTLRSWGLVACCNAGGAGSSRQFALWLEDFRGRHVTILPDNDLPGYKHAAAVAATLLNVAASVRIVELPGLPENGDVTDWRDQGGTLDEFRALVDAAQTLDEAALAARRIRWGLAQERLPYKVASGPTQSASPKELPWICVSNRPFADISADALAALESANEPPKIFVRCGKPCRVYQDENGRPLIEQMTDSQMRFHMARTAHFVYEARGDLKHTAPPIAIVKDLLANESFPFPGLLGIIEIPVVRPDGTVFEEAGYDPLTKLIYYPAPKLRCPTVPESPSGSQIDRARSIIEEMIGDFPFADTTSKTNAVAAFLTPIVRPLIDGPTPLGLLDAPMPGTGKSLFAECVGIVATGRSAPLMTAPGTEDEWKSITASLLEGTTMMTIDNLEGKLESASLASVLTSTTWEDRILGFTKKNALPQRASWLATGNNIMLGRDLPRRCYLIRMDAKNSKPQERTGWRHPELRKWVAEHRGELIWALLTLVRAWYSSGRPEYVTVRFGGFESWTLTVGNILAHAGYGGFLGNKNDLYLNNDADGGQWEAFFEAWDYAFQDRPVTVADALRELATNCSLRDAIPDWLADSYHREPGKFRQLLGQGLARQRDTQYGPFRLERAGENRRKVAQWRMVLIPDADKAA
jgi:CHC2 zinc finger